MSQYPRMHGVDEISDGLKWGANGLLVLALALGVAILLASCAPHAAPHHPAPAHRTATSAVQVTPPPVLIRVSETP